MHFSSSPYFVSTVVFLAQQGSTLQSGSNPISIGDYASNAATYFQCQVDQGIDAPRRDWPSQYPRLEDYCTDPKGLNATCVGHQVIINNQTAPPIKKPDPGLPKADPEASCWKRCDCRAEIEATQAASTEDTGNNVQAIWRDRDTSSASAAGGSSVQKDSSQTTSSWSSTTAVNVAATASTSASVTPSTLRTTKSSSASSSV